MPQLNAAKKYVRKTKRRTVRNNAVKKKMRISLRDTRKLVEDKKAEGKIESIQKTTQLLDKSAKRHLIHRNKANRLKSKLAKKANQK